MNVEREKANGKIIHPTEKTHKVEKCNNGILNRNLPIPHPLEFIQCILGIF
jgi:hypothetical protein